MKVLERIIDSVGEPGKHDLWIKHGESGAELKEYVEGEGWVTVGGTGGSGDGSGSGDTDTTIPIMRYDFTNNTGGSGSGTAAELANMLGVTEEQALGICTGKYATVGIQHLEEWSQYHPFGGVCQYLTLKERSEISGDHFHYFEYTYTGYDSEGRLYTRVYPDDNPVVYKFNFDDGS